MRPLCLLSLVVALSQTGTAQFRGPIRGIPPSVTSIGGSQSSGISASVTSLRSAPVCCGFRSGFEFSRSGVGFGRNPGLPFFTPFFPVFVSVPVAVPALPFAYDDLESDLPSAEDVVRVRRRIRRPEREDYDEDTPAPTAERRPAPRAQEPAPVATTVPPAPEPPEPPTVLVFRDGHKIEIRAYAIYGGTLYDLSGGARKRIPLSELDLDATSKANEDRGLSFRIPQRSS